MKQLEHKLQKHCVKYFRYQYPHLRLNFFSVPNGGYRNLSTAQKLKAEGAVSGVVDLLLLVPNSEHNGLCIEMKIKPNKPSEAQNDWMRAVTLHGYKCAVCFTFDEFKTTIENYLKN